MCANNSEWRSASPRLAEARITFCYNVSMFFVVIFGGRRYRKGDMVMMGNRWWEMHAELMAVATEMVLPLSITAIFSSSGTTSGSHSSEHAK